MWSVVYKLVKGDWNNYVSFKDGDDESVGAIHGDGSASVELVGAGDDYAEWLPHRESDETIESGDVVGVHGGEVSLATEDADRAMVVSTSSIVTGNDPGQDPGARDDHEKVAFVEQTLAEVPGAVDEFAGSARADDLNVAATTMSREGGVLATTYVATDILGHVRLRGVWHHDGLPRTTVTMCTIGNGWPKARASTEQASWLTRRGR